MTSKQDLIEEAIDLQSRHFVFDAHSDIPIMDVYPRRLRGQKQVMKRIHLPRFAAGKVNGAILTIQGDFARFENEYGGALKVALQVIDFMNAEVAESERKFTMARSATEIEEAYKKGSFAALGGLEGTKAIEGSLEVLHVLHKLGIRSVALTHNVPNQLGHGAGVKENYGLTELGKSFVEEIDKLHMVLDLVHLSERSFFDAIETTNSTPIISHTACSAICHFALDKVPWRNATDKQLEGVADRGGVVGLAFLKPFVTTGQQASIDDTLKHLEHLINLVGIDHVGIGPDYVDFSSREDQSYIGELFPLGEELNVKNLENITRIPNFTAALIEKGYSEDEISKILGRNFLAVLKRILG